MDYYIITKWLTTSSTHSGELSIWRFVGNAGLIFVTYDDVRHVKMVDWKRRTYRKTSDFSVRTAELLTKLIDVPFGYPNRTEQKFGVNRTPLSFAIPFSGLIGISPRAGLAIDCVTADLESRCPWSMSWKVWDDFMMSPSASTANYLKWNRTIRYNVGNRLSWSIVRRYFYTLYSVIYSPGASIMIMMTIAKNQHNNYADFSRLSSSSSSSTWICIINK